MNGKKVLLIFHKGIPSFTRHAIQCLHIKKKEIAKFILNRKSVIWCSLFVQLDILLVHCPKQTDDIIDQKALQQRFYETKSSQIIGVL